MILAHELSHYFFNHTAPDAKMALGAKFTSSTDPLAVVSFGVFDEGDACAIGNGLAGQHYQPNDFVDGSPRTGRLTANPVGLALLPAVQGIFDRGVRISSDEFVSTYLAAARARFPGGVVPPIEHLRSHVFAGEPRFEAATRELLDASLAGPPGYRAFPRLDSSAKAFLVSHPYISAAVFKTPDEIAEVFDALQPEPRHRAVVLAMAARGRPFVYALPRTSKSYAFVFVAKTDAEMHVLVARFIEAKATTPGAMLQ